MKLSDSNRMTLAIFTGIARVITLIAIICLIISLVMILIYGFNGSGKRIFILSIIGGAAFWLIAGILKTLIRKSENES